jgi:hypothetical protein
MIMTWDDMKKCIQCEEKKFKEPIPAKEQVREHWLALGITSHH